MWEFNFGEWSEAYVFLRLLSNGRIYAANADFEKNDSAYIDILNVIRHEKGHQLEYKRTVDSAEAYDNGVLFRVMAYSELIERANFLYNSIKKVSSNNRKFSVPDIENYLKTLRFSQPKIPKLPDFVASQYGKKTDIIITMEDSADRSVSTVGFSIKSHLGSASSLFNSSLASRLIYEVIGCNDDQMNNINGKQIDSETGMIEYIKNHPDLSLQFEGISDEFQDNLDFVELTMPQIFSCMMLIQTGYYERAASVSTKDIVAKIAEINPIGVRRPEVWYEAKMKDFLYATFSGLTASEPWDGRKKLSGGYIDVGMSGDMLYYRAVSDDIFNNFLYEHTYIDRPSRGVNKDIAKIKALAALNNTAATEDEINSAKLNKDGKPKAKKGDWGYIYKVGDKYYLALNFQIRFK